MASASRRPEVVEQLEHLGLDGHVERSRRLVAEQDGRLGGERDRDQHALAHPAGELMGIRAARAGPGRGSRRALSSSTARSHDCRRGEAAHASRHLGDLRADGLDRIERAQRILEDHRQPCPQRAPHRPRRARAAERRRARPCRPRAGPPAGRSAMIARSVRLLPEPDSPTMPERAPGGHLERDTVDGAEAPARPRDRDGEVVDRQDGSSRDGAHGAAARRPARRRSARARGR